MNTTGMYFQGDLLNILAAADAANGWADIIDTRETQIYRRGYEDAIGIIANAVGFSYEPRSQMPKRRQDTLPPDYVPFTKR